MKKEIVVQFSGGIDSLYVAHLLAEKYDRVHLLTFNKGYLHFFLKANKKNVELLRKIHGKDKFVYKILDIKNIFKEMAVKSFRETSKKYGNENAWCIPCRASMSIMSVIYALENDIKEFTDGANWEQAPDGEKLLVTADNYPEFLDTIKSFAKDFYVKYFPVVYDLNTRNDRREKLKEMGAKIDFNSMGREKKSIFDVFNPDFYKRVQPMCLSGYIVHWKRNFFNVKENITKEMVVNAIKPKLGNIGKKLIMEYFDKNGKDINEIVAKRKPGFSN